MSDTEYSGLYKEYIETADKVLEGMASYGLLPSALDGISGAELVDTARGYITDYISGIMVIVIYIFSFLYEYKYTLLFL